MHTVNYCSVLFTIWAILTALKIIRKNSPSNWINVEKLPIELKFSTILNVCSAVNSMFSILWHGCCWSFNILDWCLSTKYWNAGKTTLLFPNNTHGYFFDEPLWLMRESNRFKHVSVEWIGRHCTLVRVHFFVVYYLLSLLL